MKKITATKLLGLIIIFNIIISTGCLKKRGCTDDDALNYDKVAEQNCCCEYNGRLVFWFNEFTSERLMDSGAVSLIYYLNGEPFDTAGAERFYGTAPDCGQNGSVSVTKHQGSMKNVVSTYQVKDQTGRTYWNDTIILNAFCQDIELNW